MHGFAHQKKDFLTIQERDMPDFNRVVFFISENQRNYEMVPTGPHGNLKSILVGT